VQLKARLGYRKEQSSAAQEVRMPLSSDTRRPDRTPEGGSELTPLVTDEARGFLEGKISVEDYSELVRRHAADEARLDAASSYLRPARMLQNRSVILLAVLGVAIYAVIGAILSSNKESGLALIAALSAAVIGAITGISSLKAYESLFKRK
jgi:hypothetical protein